MCLLHYFVPSSFPRSVAALKNSLFCEQQAEGRPVSYEFASCLLSPHCANPKLCTLSLPACRPDGLPIVPVGPLAHASNASPCSTSSLPTSRSLSTPRKRFELPSTTNLKVVEFPSGHSPLAQRCDSASSPTLTYVFCHAGRAPGPKLGLLSDSTGAPTAQPSPAKTERRISLSFLCLQ